MFPNILFITIDNIRADKFNKNSSCKIPALTNLINNGVIFRQAISGSDGTAIGLSNIFTGNYSIRSGTKTYTFKKNFFTYFDELQKNGFHTYCCIPDLQYLKHVTSKFNDIEIYPYVDRSLYTDLFNGLGSKILQKLKSSRKQPWLIYTHLMDAKPPFTLPTEFDQEKYGETKTDRILSAIDFWIEKFMHEIDLTNTLVIISSDHGNFIPDDEKGLNYMPTRLTNVLKSGKNIPIPNSIKDRLYVTARKVSRFSNKENLRNLDQYKMRSFETRTKTELFDELIRIPLIFSGIGIKSNDISDQVRQIDIFPTIFDLIGLKSINEVQGRSLLSLLKGKTMDELPAFIENSILIEKNAAGSKKEGNFIGIRTSNFKYQRSRNSKDRFVSLYNLVNDPKELKNLAEKSSENAQKLYEMEQILHDIISEDNKKTSISDNDDLSKSEQELVKEELRKLGYI